MRIIGITGPSGSGKSLLSARLAQLNIPVLDADEMYHSLLVPPSVCLDDIRRSFGDEVFCADGSLDRKRLAALVFSDSAKLDLLNSTVLGHVIAQIRRMISLLAAEGASVVALDAPTLIESGFYRECDTVVAIIAPREERIRRIMERDGLTLGDAVRRIDSQKPDSFYSEHSTFTIFNRSDVDVAFDELTSQLQQSGLLDSAAYPQ